MRAASGLRRRSSSSKDGAGTLSSADSSSPAATAATAAAAPARSAAAATGLLSGVTLASRGSKAVIDTDAYWLSIPGLYYGADVACHTLRPLVQPDDYGLSEAGRSTLSSVFKDILQRHISHRHPNVVDTYGFFHGVWPVADSEGDGNIDNGSAASGDHSQRDQVWLVTEYLPLNLFTVLHHSKLRLSFSEVVRVAVAIAAGITFLHAVHRTPHGALSSKCVHLSGWSEVVKVGGMGSAQVLELFKQTHSIKVPRSGYDSPGHTDRQTNKSADPRSKAADRKGMQNDVWCFAVLLAEMLTGRNPASSAEDVEAILGGACEACPALAPLILQCTHRQPDVRPPFSAIVAKLRDLQRLHTYKPLPTTMRGAGIFSTRQDGHRAVLAQISESASTRNEQTSVLVRQFRDLASKLDAAADAQQDHMQFLGTLQVQLMQQNARVTTHAEVLRNSQNEATKLLQELSNSAKADRAAALRAEGETEQLHAALQRASTTSISTENPSPR